MTTRPVNLIRSLPTGTEHLQQAEQRDGTAMNKLETRFSEWLVDQNPAHWTFGSVKLRLADRTWYTPDFMAWWHTGLVSVYEVKGSWRAPHQEDSRVKLKVAAEAYPMWQFFSATHSKRGGWKFEPFASRRMVPSKPVSSSRASSEVENTPPREAFFAALQARLDKGAEAYGDRSFKRTPEDLIGELQQEALDLAGWGFVLWARLGAMQEAARVVR